MWYLESKNVVSGIKNVVSGIKNVVSGIKNVVSGIKNVVSGIKNVVETFEYQEFKKMDIFLDTLFDII